MYKDPNQTFQDYIENHDATIEAQTKLWKDMPLYDVPTWRLIEELKSRDTLLQSYVEPYEKYSIVTEHGTRTDLGPATVLIL